jgi:dTDP-glucose pyrophosphorylase
MHHLLIDRHHLTLPHLLRQFETTQSDMLIVVDDARHLVGVIHRQEVQRALLNGRTQVTDMMVAHPPQLSTAHQQVTTDLLLRQPYRYLPVVNAQGQVETVIEVHPRQWRYRPNPVVIMAGGLGRRLGDLTRDLPKPMLPLGHKPVLHLMLDSLIERGFGRFYFCVNYKAEVIKEYFGDGSRFHAQITYVEESEPLGTAGSLHLIREELDQPFLVMNGDLVTTLNFESLLDFHVEKEAVATMCLHEYSYRLPFGVVNTRQSRILSLAEKPYQQHFINAGIYVLNPAALDYLPAQPGRYDMTTLFDQMLNADEALHAYHINEFWMDIGQRSDYEATHALFSRLALCQIPNDG